MCNKTLVIERVKECLDIAKQQWPYAVFEMPTIRFDKRGRVAGTANGHRWELNFNMVLLNENVEDFVKHVVAHEVAHLIDHQVYDLNAPRYDRYGRRKKRQPHGPNWKSIMGVLGVPAERCHKYDTSNARQTSRKRKQFAYECTGCGQTLTMSSVRHNKQQSGKASYSHVGCGKHNKLVYIGPAS
jgi:SprT protein